MPIEPKGQKRPADMTSPASKERGAFRWGAAYAS
ncbi:hypothetical protein SAMN05444161_6845 [Rhizobiales bacterium GAS191]|nr:hypothetical protein SAMN05519103_08964 [Rhizobiales bacterium GAS113]SEE71741.1 hypothetical protein SAMN05444161_6845 [Rhizobiales bacterium GAS191]